MTALAKVFMSGNSQAIRLPRAFRIASSVVRIRRTPEGLLITDEESQLQRTKKFAELQGSCPDFPEVEPNDHPNLTRELE
jgi:antitoxin VapB